MIKSIEFGKQEFKDKRDLFLALKENKELIISNKKATKTKSTPIEGVYNSVDSVEKGIEGLEKGFIYPVINTTGYMDSHNDVHIKGIWNKSVKEKQNKIHYTTDHELKVTNIIAYPKDVELMLKDVSWKSLGYNKDGETQALIFKTNVFGYSNPQATKIVNEKIDIQHSVRMEYVKMELCVDSDDKEFKEEKKGFDKYIEQVTNKDNALEKGYFWAVTEAKISEEGSMVVRGSNDITPMNYGSEPSDDTQKEVIEPSKDIQKTAIEEFYLGMYK